MISIRRLKILLAEAETQDDSAPYSTFIRPDKDIVVDKNVIKSIVTELHLRRTGKWHDEKFKWAHDIR